MIILYMLVCMYLGILGIYTNFLCCWSCALCKCSTADHRKWQSHYHSYRRSAHYVTESTGRRLLFVLGKECRGTGWRPRSARRGRIQGKHFWYVRLSVAVIRMSAMRVCIYVRIEYTLVSHLHQYDILYNIHSNCIVSIRISFEYLKILGILWPFPFTSRTQDQWWLHVSHYNISKWKRWGDLCLSCGWCANPHHSVAENNRKWSGLCDADNQSSNWWRRSVEDFECA